MIYPKIARNFKQILICSEIKMFLDSNKVELKSEAVVQRCSVKKVFPKIFKSYLENICAGVKKVWYQCFPVSFEEISRTSILQNICERILS